MVSVNFNNNVKVYQTSGINKVNPTPFPTQVTPVSSPITNSPPTFRAEPYRTGLTIRTQLITDDEKKKYNDLMNQMLDLKSEIEDGLLEVTNLISSFNQERFNEIAQQI